MILFCRFIEVKVDIGSGNVRSFLQKIFKDRSAEYSFS